MEWEKPKKLRLLALHGGGTNAGIFRMQLAAVGRHLPEVEFVYLDGPIVYDESFPIDPTIIELFPHQVYRYWFKVKVDQAQGLPVEYPHEDVRNGINYIVSKLQETGPIDGVVGFSQGAIAAMMLVALCEAKLLQLPEGHSAPKFAVLFSPTYFGWIDTVRKAFPGGAVNGGGGGGASSKEAFAAPLATRAALYGGEEDPALQRFHDIRAMFVPETVEKHIHPNSHEVPADPNTVETIRVFLEKATGVVLNKPPPRPVSARPQSARASRPGSARPTSSRPQPPAQ